MVIESLTGLPYAQSWGDNHVGHYNHSRMLEKEKSGLNSLDMAARKS